MARWNMSEFLEHTVEFKKQGTKINKKARHRRLKITYHFSKAQNQVKRINILFGNAYLR